MYAYDTDKAWDDPTERREDRRRTGRFDSSVLVTMWAAAPVQTGHLVGPGKVRNMSLSGAAIVTKHQLASGETIDISFPTAMCPDSMCLPESFLGKARVVRSDDAGKGRQRVALTFSDELVNSMEFVLYVDFLRTMSPLMKAS